MYEMPEPVQNPVTAEPVPMIPNPVLRSEKAKTTIGPVMLERVCDSGRELLTVEEVAERYDGSRSFWGCGTRFRWYLGMNCMCPGCGTMYVYTKDDMRVKKFWVNP